MSYLLDTHTILWALTGDKRLSPKAAHYYESAETGYFSIVSLWEMGIKLGLRQEDFRLTEGWEDSIPRELTRLGFLRLPVEPEHCRLVSLLPLHHKDPFDRMLIVQAQEKKLSIVSCNTKLDAYSINRIW